MCSFSLCQRLETVKAGREKKIVTSDRLWHVEASQVYLSTTVSANGPEAIREQI